MGAAPLTAAKAVPPSWRGRIIALVAAFALVAGVGVAAASITTTQAAWTDASYTTAAVTAGDWTPAPPPVTYGCVAMNANGTVMSGGTCKVTSVVYDQWGDDTRHHRNYYVTIESNAGSGYAQLTLDLSAGTPRSVGGTGTWKWGNAGTTGGEFAPTSTCAELPKLVANTPSVWGSPRTFFFSMTDNRTGMGVTCK
ncbi:MAG: hypothetical protein ABWY03_10720 [Microbacterium sp.]